jgi:NADPH:quinone reductase-like Zn-dependent oxidoreductase
MTKAIQITQFGGPEVLSWCDVELPEMGSTDVLIEHKAIGVNFIDTYHRSGLYPLDHMQSSECFLLIGLFHCRLRLAWRRPPLRCSKV